MDSLAKTLYQSSRYDREVMRLENVDLPIIGTEM